MLVSLAEDLQFDPTGRRILILGVGGACRAAVLALGRAGATWIGIANRTHSRAEALITEFADVSKGTTLAAFGLESEELSGVLPGVDLLVNTSAVGLKGESFADFPWHDLAHGVLAYDMVYGRGGTPFLHTTRAHGRRAADGLGMLAAQGEEAFFLWTGQRPYGGVVKARLLAECAEI